MARILIGGLIILIGVSALFDINLLSIIFPLILIIIGVRIIAGGKDWDAAAAREESGEDYLNEVAIFSPLNKKVVSGNFRGGKAVFVFGGGEIDISRCSTTEKEISLEVVAVFGGAKLVVPKAWQVQTEGVAIVGGYNNKAKAENSSTLLRVKGAAIFGGVEIVSGND